MVRVHSTSVPLGDVFGMEALILRKDLQQDKKSALLAVVTMFEDFQVPYAITGGLAAQLYTTQPRMTMDVDIVSLRARFKPLNEAAPWSRYGLELVFDRRRFIKLKHSASNVEIDINVDTRFARLLDDTNRLPIEGHEVCFVSALEIAFAKLRTQRSDWPRDPAKRLQDRADLIRILRVQPEIIDRLQNDKDVTDEMRSILQDIRRSLAQPVDDDLPPEDEPENA
jgi:hypothetical protein